MPSGIERPHLDSGVCQGLCDGDGWRVAHVVGVGLEGQTQHGDGLAPRLSISAQCVQHLAAHGPLARVVDLDHRFDDTGMTAVVLRRLQQRQRILGKHDPP
jgi:hypothetical protein